MGLNGTAIAFVFIPIKAQLSHSGHLNFSLFNLKLFQTVLFKTVTETRFTMFPRPYYQLQILIPIYLLLRILASLT